MKQPLSWLNNCNGHTFPSWISVEIPSRGFSPCVLDFASGFSPIGGTTGVSGTKHGPKALSAPLGGPSCEAHTDISPGPKPHVCVETGESVLLRPNTRDLL